MNVSDVRPRIVFPFALHLVHFTLIIATCFCVAHYFVAHCFSSKTPSIGTCSFVFHARKNGPLPCEGVLWDILYSISLWTSWIYHNRNDGSSQYGLISATSNSPALWTSPYIFRYSNHNFFLRMDTHFVMHQKNHPFVLDLAHFTFVIVSSTQWCFLCLLKDCLFFNFCLHVTHS